MTEDDWLTDPHRHLQLTRLINAAGTYTPLGVSRSSGRVAAAAAGALQHWFVMTELQQLVGQRLSALGGCEAAAVTHCAAAGITLCVAAAIAGTEPERVKALPDVGDLPRRVVLPVCHAVDYGHPITQDVRLAGGLPLLAGTAQACPTAALEAALCTEGVVALLLVSSRLTTGQPLDLRAAVRLAHARGVPAIIDAAAQDRRIDELMATGCDALVLSGQKYLAAPTAGLVLGTRAFIAAVHAQERGIGRAMKPSKEALLGVLAALEDRQREDPATWARHEKERAHRVAAALGALPGLAAVTVPDPVGMPFERVAVSVDSAIVGTDACGLANRLAQGNPSVRVMQQELNAGRLILELVGLTVAEEEGLVAAVRHAMGPVQPADGGL